MRRLTWRNPLNDVTRGRAEELKARLMGDQIGMIKGRARQRWGKVKQATRHMLKDEETRLEAQSDSKRELG
jgi:hypothetical protein